MTTYYAQRATAGLITAEAATPNAVGQTYPNAVRAAGGHMFPQLQHGGRASRPAAAGLTPVAPPPVPLPETIFTPDGHRPAVVPRGLSREGIRSAVADFAAAARRAVDAGFEGVEVHSANGHLPHQFLAAGADLVARLRLGAPLNPVRGRYFRYVGGAAGYTGYPALAGQPSSSDRVAFDGPRVA